MYQNKTLYFITQNAIFYFLYLFTNKIDNTHVKYCIASLQ